MKFDIPERDVRKERSFFMSEKKNNRQKLLVFIQFSLLLAIELIVCFTPLGTLPALGPLSATLSHVPVIITAVILGTGAGTGMGFVFGLCSFVYWTFVAPGAFSFIYTPFYTAGVFHGNFGSLLICFLPRILIGLFTSLVFLALTKVKLNSYVSAGVAGIVGSLTNTILVLGGIALFFGQQYLQATDSIGKSLYAILGLTVLTNGLPEALIGGVAAAFIAVPVKRIIGKQKLNRI